MDLIYPELLLAMMMMPGPMKSDEAVLIRDAIQMSDYSYSAGRKVDPETIDPSRRRLGNFVAIDAVNYGKDEGSQFSPKAIRRELHKAYVGFHVDGITTIRTGNWGSGAFRGNKGLKFVIQVMACVAAGKKMIYSCFEDSDFRDLTPILDAINGVSVGDLYRKLTVEKDYDFLNISRHSIS